MLPQFVFLFFVLLNIFQYSYFRNSTLLGFFPKREKVDTAMIFLVSTGFELGFRIVPYWIFTALFQSTNAAFFAVLMWNYVFEAIYVSTLFELAREGKPVRVQVDDQEIEWKYHLSNFIGSLILLDLLFSFESAVTNVLVMFVIRLTMHYESDF